MEWQAWLPAWIVAGIAVITLLTNLGMTKGAIQQMQVQMEKLQQFRDEYMLKLVELMTNYKQINSEITELQIMAKQLNELHGHVVRCDEEIRRIRDWRHDEVAPWVQKFEYRLTEIERRNAHER